jgi:hypothetical protein
MTEPVYSTVNDSRDIIKINKLIRKSVATASTRSAIIRLLRRSLYLVTLTQSSPWIKHFGNKITSIRSTAISQYSVTATFANEIIKKKNLGEFVDTNYG